MLYAKAERLADLVKIKETVKCTIIRRTNRFVVEVEVEGKPAKAYINNTGRLQELLQPGRRGHCLPNPLGRRTQLRLFAINLHSLAAIIDTQLQMQTLEKALSRGLLPWCRNCRIIRRNPRLGSSVLDYLIERQGRETYTEVKSAVLAGPSGYAMYPDCPTQRGRRHIQELTRHAQRGGAALIIFIAALPGAKAFKPYAKGDPQIPGLLRHAAQAGVEIRAIAMHYNPRKATITLYNPNLPVKI